MGEGENSLYTTVGIAYREGRWADRARMPTTQLMARIGKGRGIDMISIGVTPRGNLTELRPPRA